MSKRVWKMVTVTERFRDERNIQRERLSCGHTRPDPELSSSNETTFKIKRIGEAIFGGEVKARCYKCGREAQNDR